MLGIDSTYEFNREVSAYVSTLGRPGEGKKSPLD